MQVHLSLVICDEAHLIHPWLNDFTEGIFSVHQVGAEQLARCLSQEQPDALVVTVEALDSEQLSSLTVLREMAPSSPCVVVTGAPGGLVAEAIRGGIECVLPAPMLSAGLLAQMVEQAIARHAQQATLHHQLQRLSRGVQDACTLFERLPVALMIVNNRDEIRMCNESAARLFGLGNDELIGSPFGFPHAPDEMHDLRLPGHQGSERRIQLQSRRVRWENAVADLVVLEEVSEQYCGQDAGQPLHAAIEQCSDTVIITDLDGVIVYANPAFEKITGYAVEEVLGKTPRLLRSGAHDADFYREMWACLERGEAWRGRMVNRRKDGSCYEEEATIAPVCNEAGDVTNYVGVKRDITALVALEEQLHQSQKMEAVGRLAGGVAHDFNNLLTVIGGQCQLLLLKYQDNETLIAKVNQIREAADKASSLTRQLLGFSRKHLRQTKLLNLNELITDFQKMLRRLIGEDILLEVELLANPACVDGDAGQLEQVIMNLAVNARDAMPDGGQLTIRTGNVQHPDSRSPELADMPPGNYVKVSVSDTGCGIADDIVDLIFEPFFTTKGAGKGTGLGLAMAYANIKQSAGHIAVKSRPGGTTFVFYLPQAEGRSGARESAKAPDLSGTHGTETILVVEDEKGVREMARDILSLQGYKVLLAESPTAALQLVEAGETAVDLMLTDVIMPGMSGMDLARKVMEIYPELPVLFMSGYTDRFEDASKDSHFVKHFLQKPFSPQELGLKVRESLNDQKSPRHVDD